jgi:hypothetical protein
MRRLTRVVILHLSIFATSLFKFASGNPVPRGRWKTNSNRPQKQIALTALTHPNPLILMSCNSYISKTQTPHRQRNSSKQVSFSRGVAAQMQLRKPSIAFGKRWTAA